MIVVYPVGDKIKVAKPFVKKGNFYGYFSKFHYSFFPGVNRAVETELRIGWRNVSMHRKSFKTNYACSN